MIGAIIGDIVGSPYEGSHMNWVDDKNFPLFAKQWSRFTDDTILTCATADALLHPSTDDAGFFNNVPPFSFRYKDWALKYPGRGYGSGFQEWVDRSDMTVNNSYANGAMMRCSPIALFYDSLEVANSRALQSISMTHDSPESARGVRSIVSAIHMAKTGATKLQIKAYVAEQFGHMCEDSLDDLRNKTASSIRCNLSAPRALTCFFESTDYESAIRNAVYIKGDTDTHAAIAGSIAEAFYGVRSIPQYMIDEMKQRITPEMLELINEFYRTLGEIDENSVYRGIQI